MHEWHGGSPEELGEQQPLTGHSLCQHMAEPSPTSQRLPHLLQQTSTQTLLRPRLKCLRTDSLESNCPKAALFVLGVLQLCCAFMFHKTHPGLLSWLCELRTACTTAQLTSQVWNWLSTSLHTADQHFWDKELQKQVYITELIYSTWPWSSVCTKTLTFLGKRYLFL